MDILNILLHFETYISQFIIQFGPWVYAFLFFIIFAETGLVVTPFLPGDSLLFVVGALSGGGLMNIWLVYILLLLAAILGNTLNYWFGRTLGERAFARENSRIFNKAYLEKTREFFDKHGGKTIILSRFLPIIRSFAPFVAGMGKMHYGTFQMYNIIGGFLWVSILLFAGYFFGGLPIVKNNFEKAIFLIIFLSILPAIIEVIRHKMKKTKNKDKETSFKEIKDTLKKEHLND